MKIETKTMVAIGLIGIAGLLFFRNRMYRPGPQYPPPPPPPRTQSDIQKWNEYVNMILNTYGNVRQLWEPGGPFYKPEGGTGSSVVDDLLPDYRDYA